MEKSELLIRLSESPDDIAELSRAELEQAQTELREYGAALLAGLDESDDKKADIGALDEAKERLAAVKDRLAEFQAEDDEIAAKAAELATEFETPEEPATEEVVEASDETPEVVEDIEVPEAAEEETEVVLEQPEPIAAAKPSLGKIAARAPKAPEPEKALVASAPLQLAPQYPKGYKDKTEIGKAASEVLKQQGGKSSFPRIPIAHFDNSDVMAYEALDEVSHDTAMLAEMQKDLGRTPLEALTAAVAFCAPAEPRYDYFGIAERAGMLQLPTINASRGRITYRTSPSYQSVLDNASWSGAAGQIYTAANAESGASKVSFDAECPGTNTCAVDAFPVDIRFTNWTDRFDPETVANVMENTMIFHDHFVNGTHIASIVTGSTARGGGDTGGGGLVNVANLVGFEAAAYRDTFRMSPEATLELVIPAWVIDALVADLVARDSTMSFENARARVRAVFASLGLRVQAVQDWQSIGDANDGGWPPAADFLLFAPGTWVRLDGGTLDLGIVRDSTLNTTNEFSVFVETWEEVCEIGHDSWLLDDITICPRGATANRVTLDCNPGFGS